MAVTALGLAASGQAAAATISPSALPRLTTIDERFQSYNVEMAEVIGGNFWKPYAKSKPAATVKPITSFEIGKDPTMFERRAPVDLTNSRLRKLAAALGPAYVRVSGTWASEEDDQLEFHFIEIQNASISMRLLSFHTSGICRRTWRQSILVLAKGLVLRLNLRSED
jgi:hypothetical protein